MRPVNRIVIVGGGTAGWLSAAYLLKRKRKQCEIIVVDKTVSETVSVGEATIISFKQFMQDCGFSVEQWFTAIDATFKTGILFKDWQEEGKNLWHPFGHLPDKLNLWTNHKEFDFHKHACAFYDPSVTENKISQSAIGSFAYHIDCGKLVKFIKSKILNEITFVPQGVIDVNRNERGGISSIKLESGEEIESDLFIDCTGFKRLLGLKYEGIYCGDRLFCDSAIAGHVNYIDPDSEMQPYTECHAVDHGWIWKIPTQSRLGTGLVYNRSVTDTEEAKEYFNNYWEGRVDDLKVLDWTPHYRKTFWHDNVVCIGLSAGFIEPLESSGIALITSGLTSLAYSINGNRYDDFNAWRYNLKMQGYFEECVDFVNMHYAYNKRKTGKFWEYIQKDYTKTKALEFFEYEASNNPYELPCGCNDIDIFTGESWSLFLCQMIPDNICSKESFLPPTAFFSMPGDYILHKDFVLKYNRMVSL